MEIMKKALLYLIFIASPQLIFASFDNFVIRTGEFNLSIRYHFNDGVISGCGEYESYWDLINLINKNRDILGSYATDISLFVSSSNTDNMISAHIENGSQYLGNHKNIERNNIEEIVLFLTAELQSYFNLQTPANYESIYFDRVIIPLDQFEESKSEKFNFLEYSNMYIGAVDGMTFWGVYDLVLFDPALLDELKSLLNLVNYSHYHYKFSESTINALQNTGFLERK